MAKSGKLPSLSWREIIKALKKIGYLPVGQSGSHIILKNVEGKRITVPRHDPVGKGLLLEILSEANITKEEFLYLL